ncbi:O-antigen polymerase, partial [Acinetobacter ursingii]|uniref:O-antigen polymerase n=1 Tax=Acinetobacter ursingii TaxID=108980 RepID=UPI0012503AB2
MIKFLIYPLNIATVLFFALFCSLFNLSSFFEEVSFNSFALIVCICCIYIIQYFFIKDRVKLNKEVEVNPFIYKKYLIFGFVGFLVEFMFYGVPLLSSSGRDSYGGIPVLHVVFYSCIFVSVLFSSLYAKKNNIILCLVSVLILSVFLLSRQLMMVSFLIVLISSMIRYEISKKTWIKTLLSLVAVVFLFSVIGNYRQKLSGDYVDQYIIVIGGANKNGELLGEVLYWVWLYVASPIYNLIVNFGSYYQYGEKCNTAIYYGSCSGGYIPAVLLPDTIVKYLGFDKFVIDLAVSHLNVGTGFSAAASLMGFSGVLLQILLQSFFYVFAYRLIAYRFNAAFIVYFSVLYVFL